MHSSPIKHTRMHARVHAHTHSRKHARWHTHVCLFRSHAPYVHDRSFAITHAARWDAAATIEERMTPAFMLSVLDQHKALRNPTKLYTTLTHLQFVFLLTQLPIVPQPISGARSKIVPPGVDRGPG